MKKAIKHMSKSLRNTLFLMSGLLILGSGLILKTQAVTIGISESAFNTLRTYGEMIFTLNGDDTGEVLTVINQNNTGDAYFKGKVKASLFCDENGDNCKDMANLTVTGGVGTETDPIWNAASGTYLLKTELTGAETDPTVLSSVKDGISRGEIVNKVSEYITYRPNNVECTDGQVLKWTSSDRWECNDDATGAGGVEADPVFTARDKSTDISITESQISDLGTYIEAADVPVLETDPVFTARDKTSGISISESQISDLQAYLTTASATTIYQEDIETKTCQFGVQSINDTGLIICALDPTLRKEASNNNIFYTAGNVGIGTSTPSAKLHVGGDVKIDKNLFVGTYADGEKPLIINDNVKLPVENTYIRIKGDDLQSTCSIINGTSQGQLLIIQGIGTARVEEVFFSSTSANLNLGATSRGGSSFMLTLIWGGSSWNEINFVSYP